MGKKAIVFEGGGCLCAAQPVMLNNLHKRGIIDINDYDVFVGTSAGGLNAIGLGLGVSLDEMEHIWFTAEQKEIMPRKWFSPILKKRVNKIGDFVEEKLLKPKGYTRYTTLGDIYSDTGKEIYTVATVLQNNKGIIFGHDWHDISIKDAGHFTVSHPIVFPTNMYVTKIGSILDLTDGGVIQNCPTSVLAERTDIDEVLCVSVEGPETNGKGKRYNSMISSLKRIVEGIVSRNEFVSYSVAFNRWGDNFKVWQCKMDNEIDIFEVKDIPYIMHQARIFSTMGGPETMSQWVPRRNGKKQKGSKVPKELHESLLEHRVKDNINIADGKFVEEKLEKE